MGKGGGLRLSDYIPASEGQLVRIRTYEDVVNGHSPCLVIAEVVVNEESTTSPIPHFYL